MNTVWRWYERAIEDEENGGGTPTSTPPTSPGTPPTPPNPTPSPSPSPNGDDDDDDDEFPIWNPLDSDFWDVDNYALWIYVGILLVALGLIGLTIFAIVSSKRGDDLF